MGKEKFNFDPQTHSFVPVIRNLRTRAMRAGCVISAILIFAVLIRFTTDRHLTSTKEIKLLADKEAYIDQYLNCEERIQEMEASIEELQTRDDSIYRAFYQLDPIPKSIREAGLGGILFMEVDLGVPRGDIH